MINLRAIVIALALAIAVSPLSPASAENNEDRSSSPSKTRFCLYCDSVTSKNINDLEPDMLNYLMVQGGTPYPPDGKELNSKYQISFKQHVYKGLTVAYTQRSFWEVGRDSWPFRDHNLNPSVYWDIANCGVEMSHAFFSMGRLGLIEHESNGRDGDSSRSWNRLYWEPKLFIEKPYRFIGNAVFAFKYWDRAFDWDKKHNKDIHDYYGSFELSTILEMSAHYLSIKARKGWKEDRGNVLVEYLYDTKWKNLFIYAQLWDGYGENLLNYNDRATRCGVGFAFSPMNAIHPRKAVENNAQ